MEFEGADHVLGSMPEYLLPSSTVIALNKSRQLTLFIAVYLCNGIRYTLKPTAENVMMIVDS